MMPSAPANIVHSADKPRLGPTKPMEMVKKWKLPRNQKGALATELGVTFVFRNVIDRVAFDGQAAARLDGVRRLRGP
jgi:hypothetical protein